MRVVLFAIAFVKLCSMPLQAQDVVVFEGTPLRKVESSFLATNVSNMSADEGIKYQVRIVEHNGKYYWASRERRQLVRTESGAYITFFAVDGSGYVRVGSPMLLELRDQLSEEQRQKEVGYSEHLLLQLSSVTYYGNRR